MHATCCGPRVVRGQQHSAFPELMSSSLAGSSFPTEPSHWRWAPPLDLLSLASLGTHRCPEFCNPLLPWTQEWSDTMQMCPSSSLTIHRIRVSSVPPQAPRDRDRELEGPGFDTQQAGWSGGGAKQNNKQPLAPAVCFILQSR